MKKHVIICISVLLILLGCRGTAKDTSVQPMASPTDSLQVEIAPLSATPTAALQETPWPYPSNESIFVPEATETPTATPTIEPTAEPTAEPTDTPAPAERYLAEEGVETVAWLSDTQHYANYRKNQLSPDIYPAMTGFLRDKADQMHLVYVVHTGDLVHVNDDLENWQTAREAMDLLNGIPTGVLAGNHDMDPSKGGYPTLATSRAVAHQAPLSVGFSRQEYWTGLPFPFPGDCPNPGIESPTLHADSLLSEPPGKVVKSYSKIPWLFLVE